jgi:flagellar biosynthesis/type III secretory pathway chaperone
MQVTSDGQLESEIGQLLADISDAQSEMLQVLGKKRELLMKFDGDGLAHLAPREEQLVEKLQSCLTRRTALLAQANESGRPHGSLRELADVLPGPGRKPLNEKVKKASSQARILQLQSITNWVLVQRTLIHLSQMLEIIATGGQSQPTYEKGAAHGSSGALVDQAA